jgi:hypothetical protein
MAVNGHVYGVRGINFVPVFQLDFRIVQTVVFIAI